MMDLRSALAELAALLDVAATALDQMTKSQQQSAALKKDLQEVHEVAERLRAIGARLSDKVRGDSG